MAAFVWGQGGEQLTPETLARRRLIAEAMMQRATDASPIQHWSQGASRVLQALSGVMLDKQARDDATAGKESASADFSKLFGGGSAAPAAATPTTAMATPEASAPAQPATTAPSSSLDLDKYREAISKIESGGKYDALGPQTADGDQAYGRYQIMGKNVGPWTEAHLGQRLSPQEFLANPRAQDAVFNGQFGQYVDKFGPQGAAQAWFGGPGAVGKTDRQDVLGTSVGDYGDKFAKFAGLNVGSQDTPAPGVVRVAQAMTAQQPSADAAMKMMNNPWASPGQKAVAQAILTKQFSDPLETKLRELQVRQAEQALSNAPLDTEAKRIGLLKGRAELSNMPIEQEGKQLANERQRREIGQIGNTTDIRDYEYAKARGFTGTLPEYQQQLRKAGATNVNTGPGPTQAVFKEVSERADAARAAAAALPAFSEARKAIDSGAILGAGADMRLGMQKIGAMFGLDPAAAENTEVFRSAIAPVVLSTVKGLGAGTGISNADREFAEKAAGGNISLEPGSIRRLLDIGQRAAEARIKSHQTMLDKVYPDSDPQNAQVRALFGIDAPAAPAAQAAPQGPDPAAMLPPQPAPPAPKPPPPQPGMIRNGYRFKGGNPADPNSWEQVQ